MSKVINVGDTDENADWIKSLPGHAGERQIHEELAREYGGARKEAGERLPDDDTSAAALALSAKE